MNLEQLTEASRYVAAIRNGTKYNYAQRWYNYRVRGANEPSGSDLSYMAAQAVRMRLDALLGLS